MPVKKGEDKKVKNNMRQSKGWWSGKIWKVCTNFTFFFISSKSNLKKIM